MAFFGGNANTGQPGQQQGNQMLSKPGGFGSFSLGNTSTLGATPQATGFGAPTNQAPAFGATANPAPAFGAPSNPAPAFGAPTNPAPAFGATSNPAPAFGSNTNTTGFGAPSGGSFSFGGNQQQQQQQSTVPTLTGFGGFSTQTTSTAPTFGGLGQTTGATNTGFGTGGFGTNTGGFGGFGNTATTSTAPLFGGFGTNTSNSFGGFSSSFGRPATTAVSGFGGFGSSFGQPLQQQQQQQQQFQQQQAINPDEAFAQSIFNVSIYNDERDTILAKWNYLQALWGTGKAYYSHNAPALDITPQNYLCRFKAMGYIRLPGEDNKMGLVALNFNNKPMNQIKDQQAQFTSSLCQLLGNKPNLTVMIDNIKSLSEQKTQVVIYVEEKIGTSTKRILATELCNFLNQPSQKQQLNNYGVEQILALVRPDEDQLKEYLDNPPKGIDPRIWKQAIEDNPDPIKFIPMPIIGFSELKARMESQKVETNLHFQYLSKVEDELKDLKQRHSNTHAKIMEYRRKLDELSHRILKIIVNQEITRKIGSPLTAEEEIIRNKLENMQALVSAPTQFKGRLSELLSQMRMQRNQWATIASEYTLNKESSEEMKNFLTMQQSAMTVLVETVNKDMNALKIVSDGLGQFASRKPM